MSRGMSARGCDAGAVLGRALLGAAARAGCPVRIEESEARSWHSATFVGARHAITLSGAASPRLARWLEALGEAELPMRGHLLADIAIDSVRAADGQCRVVLGALTLDER